MVEVTNVGLGAFKVSKGSSNVLVDFSPFMRSLKSEIGDRILFQHWNKVTGLFGVYDLGSNLYFCEYPVSQIDQRGQFFWRMAEINPTATSSPLVACNYCLGYSSVIQLPKKLILVGEGDV